MDDAIHELQPAAFPLTVKMWSAGHSTDDKPDWETVIYKYGPIRIPKLGPGTVAYLRLGDGQEFWSYPPDDAT